MSKRMLILGWVTLLGFGFLGLSMVYFFQTTTLLELLKGKWPLGQQLLAGTLTGVFGAVVAIILINATFFKNERQKYHKILNHWSWNDLGIVFISICAGVGEELLFRAGLQPFLGLWITSILFVAIHGYLNPLNWKISVYGIIMIGFIAALGYLFKTAGIIAAITAHSVFDAILLFQLVEKKSLNSV
ncbi:CPBP family intramembrane glutamic endopeptidase [Cyclobacterium marinum]|uniref:Abortive infection protein n=1 Tax=Cyclobacterium marinum (strain ATCC 25205 / DSM 745 / LMG 13164 / NCIMB 1802) TaxID=880070 RepID=G0J8I2_CYCMS|nr:CPBP family intramembrane glutamic endopeptidase [Cyclobacterium marinum]AEL28782.1 Abortive infection protein [Cyclobacterium marinum DSM 745]